CGWPCASWGCHLKKALHAQERDSEPAQQRRQAWREALAQVDVEQLIFLDESGATTQMTRSYARAPRGQRVNEATPQGRWQILTLLAALTTRGLEAPMTIAEPTDGDIFLAYLEQVLCPRLTRPGQVVSWIIYRPTKWRECANRSRRPEPGSSICRPIPPTSIPSNKLGRRSNKSCAP